MHLLRFRPLASLSCPSLARTFLAVWLLTFAGIVSAQTPGEALDFGGVRSEIAVGPYTGFIIKPRTAPTTAQPRPWVLYAPTLKDRPASTMSWYLERLLNAGFTLCGLDVGEALGNPTARKAYWQFYQILIKEHGLNPKVCLFGQSRGGLFVYNFAADHPQVVSRIVGIYPVCDLRSYPNLERAAPAYELSVPELTAQLPRHNPVDRLTPLAANKIPILHLHGDSDKTVPLDANSAILRERYHALRGEMELIVIKDAGHAEIPVFFESEKVLEFILRDLR